MLPTALVCGALVLAPLPAHAVPAAINPEGAAEARDQVHSKTSALQDSGDLTEAAERLAESGVDLKDPQLLVEAAETYLQWAGNERNLPSIDDARDQAVVALDMLYCLESRDNSQRWRPLEPGAASSLTSRAEAVLSESESLQAEIEAEIEAAAAEASAPVTVEAPKEKPPHPGRGLMVGGIITMAIGAGAAGLGTAGLLIGKKHQETADDPLSAADALSEADRGGNNANLMAIVGFSTAGAALTAGLIMTIVGAKKRDADGNKDEATNINLAPNVGPGFGGFSLAGRF